MTYATDMGFEVGKLYRVVSTEHASQIYSTDMIVRFEKDDGTDNPYFSYVSGPKNTYTDDYANFCITLGNLAPTVTVKTYEVEELLLLYIQQQYPDDKVLKALVESL